LSKQHLKILEKVAIWQKKGYYPLSQSKSKSSLKEKNMANSHSPYDVMAKIDGFSGNSSLDRDELLPR
jgi:hypothetical protein